MSIVTMRYPELYQAHVKPKQTAMLDKSNGLSTGMVAAWLFNEGAGLIVRDYSGYNNHLTAQLSGQASQWTTCPYGTALGFVAASSYYLTSPAFAFGQADNFTVFWIGKVNSTAITASVLGVIGATERRVKYAATGTVKVLNNSNVIYATGATNMVDTGYHVLCIVRRGLAGGFEMYVDGVKQTLAANDTTTHFTDNVAVRHVGRAGPTNDYLDGALSCLYIYGRDLTQGEIVALSKEPYRMFAPSPFQIGSLYRIPIAYTQAPILSTPTPTIAVTRTIATTKVRNQPMGGGAVPSIIVSKTIGKNVNISQVSAMALGKSLAILKNVLIATSLPLIRALAKPISLSISSTVVKLRAFPRTITLSISTNGFNAVPPTLSPAPVGYWKLDETLWNGTTGEVIDSSGNGNNGQAINGAVTSPNGVYGSAGSFIRNSTQYVDLGPSTSISFQQNLPLSISAWVNLSSSANVIRLYSIFGDLSATGGRGYWFYVSSFALAFDFGSQFGSPPNRLSTVGVTTINDGMWHNVVVTYDGSGKAAGVKFYVDGVLDSPNTVVFDSITGNLTTHGNTHIGSAGGTATSNTWLGMIDDVRMYDRTLSLSEVKTLYTNPVSVIKAMGVLKSLSVSTSLGIIRALATTLSLSVSSSLIKIRALAKTITYSATSALSSLKSISRTLVYSSASTVFLTSVLGYTRILTLSATTSMSIMKSLGLAKIVSETTSLSTKRAIGINRSLSSATSALIIRSLGVTKVLSSSISLSIQKALTTSKVLSSATNLSLTKAVGLTRTLSSSTSTVIKKAIGVVRSVNSASILTSIYGAAHIVSVVVNSLTTLSSSRNIGLPKVVSSSTSLYLQKAISLTRNLSSITTTSVKKSLSVLRSVNAPSVASAVSGIAHLLSVIVNSPTSIATKKNIGKIAIVSVSSALSVAKGLAYLRTVSVNATSSPFVVKSITIVKSLPIVTSAARTVNIGKITSLSAPTSLALSKTLQIIRSASSAASLQVLRVLSKSITLSQQSALSVTKSIGHAVSLASTSSTSTVKNIGRKVTYSASSVITIAFGGLKYFQTVAVNTVTSLSTIRSIGLIRLVASSPTISVRKSITSALSILVANTSSVSRNIQTTIQYVATTLTDYSQNVARTLMVVLNVPSAVSTLKNIRPILVATVTSSIVVALTTARRLTIALTYHPIVSKTLTIGKNISVSRSTSIKIVRGIGQTVQAYVATTVSSIIGNIYPILVEYFASTNLSIGRSLSKIINLSQPVKVASQRAIPRIIQVYSSTRIVAGIGRRLLIALSVLTAVSLRKDIGKKVTVYQHVTFELIIRLTRRVFHKTSVLLHDALAYIASILDRPAFPSTNVGESNTAVRQSDSLVNYVDIHDELGEI